MQDNIGCGARIRKWRKEKGLKAFQLAAILKLNHGHLSQGSLSDIENDKSNPSAPTIKSFIINTDIDILWMLTGIIDYKGGEETIVDNDPPFEITLNPRVKKILITYRE